MTIREIDFENKLSSSLIILRSNLADSIADNKIGLWLWNHLITIICDKISSRATIITDLYITETGEEIRKKLMETFRISY